MWYRYAGADECTVSRANGSIIGCDTGTQVQMHVLYHMQMAALLDVIQLRRCRWMYCITLKWQHYWMWYSYAGADECTVSHSNGSITGWDTGTQVQMNVLYHIQMATLLDVIQVDRCRWMYCVTFKWPHYWMWYGCAGADKCITFKW